MSLYKMEVAPPLISPRVVDRPPAPGAMMAAPDKLDQSGPTLIDPLALTLLVSVVSVIWKSASATARIK
jgi:hypothetical protein